MPGFLVQRAHLRRFHRVLVQHGFAPLTLKAYERTVAAYLRHPAAGEDDRKAAFLGDLLDRDPESCRIADAAIDLYTLLCAGRAPVDAAPLLIEADRRIEAERPGLPSGELIRLVTGSEDAMHFLTSGAQSAEDIGTVLRANGLDAASFGSILDFGCGCGRVLRHVRHLKGPVLHGTDSNPRLIEWCRHALPFARFSVNAPEAPLDYPADTLDFIYAISVFTHLGRARQQFWRDELRRVLVPGGYLLLTTLGLQRFHDLSTPQRVAFLRGELVVTGEADEGSNLCGAYSPERHVREVLAAGFHVVDYRPGASQGSGNQDMVLLRKA